MNISKVKWKLGTLAIHMRSAWPLHLVFLDFLSYLLNSIRYEPSHHASLLLFSLALVPDACLSNCSQTDSKNILPLRRETML
jgi:hypothetical protein